MNEILIDALMLAAAFVTFVGGVAYGDYLRVKDTGKHPEGWNIVVLIAMSLIAAVLWPLVWLWLAISIPARLTWKLIKHVTWKAAHGT